MNRIARLLSGSITNKVIFLVSLVLIAVAGILTVNTISFFEVKKSLQSMIDRDVAQIIENTKISDNLRHTITSIDLLIYTFTERNDTMAGEQTRLINEIEADMRALALNESPPEKIFLHYLDILKKIFDQFTIINKNLSAITSIENTLDSDLAQLDEIVIEKEMTIAARSSEEASSLKQLAIMLPGYREIFFEIVTEFMDAKNMYLTPKMIKPGSEQKILLLIDELEIGLNAMPIAWDEIVPHIRKLITSTSQYRLQIVRIFEDLRVFQDHLGVLKTAQVQLLVDIEILNRQILTNTHALHRKTSDNMAASTKTTIIFSSLTILLLLVIGVFTVKIVKPIKTLSIGAANIGAGNLDYKVNIKSDDEIGQLADAFNRMTSDLKTAESALRESEARYRTLVESSSDAILMLDTDRKIVSVNQGFIGLFGYERKELETKPVRIIHRSDESYRSFGDSIYPEIERSGSCRMEGEFRRKDGNIFSADTSTCAIKSTGESKEGYVAIIRDVTDQRKMEAELSKVQKLESLGVLAGGIAHDFNNFLGVILGGLSIAKFESEPGDKLFTILDEMEKASLNAKKLTQQLLTFSKGGQPIRRLSDLGELVRDSANFSLRGSNVKCDFFISSDLSPVEIDEGQMGQVINNLVLNADQAMPDGGTIQIHADNINLEAVNRLSLPPGRYIRLSIRDNGEGISPDNLAKIFDPFFTTKSQGSGLGLSVAHSIIEKHDGSLTAESELGQGAKFSIYIPAAERSGAASKHQENLPVYGQGTILVMDDEEFIREMAAKMLTKVGYRVAVAKDGSEALDMYRRARDLGKSFDAVVMDLTVPGGMGGQETILALKEIDPQVRALVSSGYSNHPIMSNFKEHGFQGVVEKPYNIQELSHALAMLIAGYN